MKEDSVSRTVRIDVLLVALHKIL